MIGSTELEQNLIAYKNNIDGISGVLNQNLELSRSYKAEIESRYNAYIRLLNQEKNSLNSILNEIERESIEFLELRNNLNAIIKNLSVSRDSNGFSSIYQQAQSLQNIYHDVVNKDIKKIQKFDFVQLPKREESLIADVSITQSKLLRDISHQLSKMSLSPNSSHNNFYKSTENISNHSLHPNLQMPKPTDDLSNLNNFTKWINNTQVNPYLEISIDKMPAHMTSYRNYLFSVNEAEYLTLFKITSNNQIIHVNNYKIPIPNVRGIAANKNYFGITYSDLNKHQLKNKNYKANGCMLFRRDSDIISFMDEIIIELDEKEDFKGPVGIALNEDYLFVCDKTLRSIFKIDLKKRTVLIKVNVFDGEPYKISINRNYVVVTDTYQHHLNIYDIEDMVLIKNLFIDQPDARNGPYGVSITDDNLIFFKNYAESQLTLIDFDFTKEYVFRKVTYNILGFTMLQTYNQLLIVGVADKRGKFKYICYSNVSE